jgi:superfamily I DNA/RNA helicase
MVVAGLSDDAFPLASWTGRSDYPAVRREAELMERALLYVALTRARKAALLTAPGEVSEWIVSVLGDDLRPREH